MTKNGTTGNRDTTKSVTAGDAWLGANAAEARSWHGVLSRCRQLLGQLAAQLDAQVTAKHPIDESLVAQVFYTAEIMHQAMEKLAELEAVQGAD